MYAFGPVWVGSFFVLFNKRKKMTGKQRIQSLRSVRMVFALAFSLFMVVNSWAATDAIPYIDENGETKYCEDYTVLTSSDEYVNLESGWYVAMGNVNMAAINVDGDANIILADGAKLTVDGGNQCGIDVLGNIAVYGQNKQTGSLSINGSSGIFAEGSVSINGGAVSATGNNAAVEAFGSVTINGGSVIATADNEGVYANGSVTINGGTISATGIGGIVAMGGNLTINGGFISKTSRLSCFEGDIVLGWTDEKNDGVMADEYFVTADGSVKIAEGKAFVDENGVIYSGTLTMAQFVVGIRGKMLTPIKPVYYVDENGKTVPCENCTVLASNDERSDLDGGWYVAMGDVNMAGITFYSIHGDVNIILADGAKLTVDGGNDQGIYAFQNIAIYGQIEQTGSLSVNGLVAISADGSVSINGGAVSATGKNTAVEANGSVTINGGSVTATGMNEAVVAMNGDLTINGGVISKTSSLCSNGGDIVLGWTDAKNDRIMADNYRASGSIRIAEGKAFANEKGAIYSGTLTSSQIGGITLRPYVPAIVVTEKEGESGKKLASIDGEFSGDVTLAAPNAVEVDEIDFNREFKAGVPATVVLPFDLPEGATTNAKFYYLKEVVQDGMSWVATMKNIGSKNLPAANTPYAVIVPDGGKLQFDLKGQKASVSTSYKDTTRVADGNWLFVGVYTYKVWEEGDEEIGLAYGFAGSKSAGGAAEGEFGKLAIDYSGDTPQYPYAYPLRAYLRKADASVQLKPAQGRPVAPGESPVANYSVELLPESIDVLFIDEDENGEQTTFMARMNTRTGEFKMLRNYDLKGRKVNGATKARGAYYGKKVLNK